MSKISTSIKNFEDRNIQSKFWKIKYPLDEKEADYGFYEVSEFVYNSRDTLRNKYRKGERTYSFWNMEEDLYFTIIAIYREERDEAKVSTDYKIEGRDMILSPVSPRTITNLGIFLLSVYNKNSEPIDISTEIQKLSDQGIVVINNIYWNRDLSAHIISSDISPSDMLTMLNNIDMYPEYVELVRTWEIPDVINSLYMGTPFSTSWVIKTKSNNIINIRSVNKHLPDKPVSVNYALEVMRTSFISEEPINVLPQKNRSLPVSEISNRWRILCKNPKIAIKSIENNPNWYAYQKEKDIIVSSKVQGEYISYANLAAWIDPKAGVTEIEDGSNLSNVAKTNVLGKGDVFQNIVKTNIIDTSAWNKGDITLAFANYFKLRQGYRDLYLPWRRKCDTISPCTEVYISNGRTTNNCFIFLRHSTPLVMNKIVDSCVSGLAHTFVDESPPTLSYVGIKRCGNKTQMSDVYEQNTTYKKWRYSVEFGDVESPHNVLYMQKIFTRRSKLSSGIINGKIHSNNLHLLFFNISPRTNIITVSRFLKLQGNVLRIAENTPRINKTNTEWGEAFSSTYDLRFTNATINGTNARGNAYRDINWQFVYNLFTYYDNPAKLIVDYIGFFAIVDLVFSVYEENATEQLIDKNVLLYSLTEILERGSTRSVVIVVEFIQTKITKITMKKKLITRCIELGRKDLALQLCTLFNIKPEEFGTNLLSLPEKEDLLQSILKPGYKRMNAIDHHGLSIISKYPKNYTLDLNDLDQLRWHCLVNTDLIDYKFYCYEGFNGANINAASSIAVLNPYVIDSILNRCSIGNENDVIVSKNIDRIYKEITYNLNKIIINDREFFYM